jgi:hypothetical protein
MTSPFSESELEAFLDEALPAEEMARLEQALRGDRQLVRRLSETCARRDAGIHTLGNIWRRGRLSCPTREQFGGYLLGTLEKEFADYITFHLQVAGCRYCRANLADLSNRLNEGGEKAHARRRKYFQSSAGYLGKITS